jgi:phosphatidylinositol 4-kinase
MPFMARSAGSVGMNNRLLTTTLDWALPDQLVFSTVSALLRLTSTHAEYGDAAATAIFKFIKEIVEKIATASCKSFDTQLCPQSDSL